MTAVEKIIDSFESSFQDKNIIPIELEMLWMKKAIAEYSIELEPLDFDEDEEMFVDEENVSRYAIDTIAALMKVYYQRRELSKVNKRVSIVTKDISIDGSNGTKTAARYELEGDIDNAKEMLFNQMPTSYV